MFSKSTVTVVVALTALAAVASLTLWRYASRPNTRPNILLITYDTLRADHSSAYGYARPTMPALERLSADGIRFEHAYAAIPATAPSHATMFTSLLPRLHGLWRNGVVLPARHTTLAEILREQGYRTSAIVSSLVVDRNSGLNQGFAHFDDDFTNARGSYPKDFYRGSRVKVAADRRADEAKQRALAWLANQGDLDGGGSSQPFFLWIHVFDPHTPYDPPDSARLALTPSGRRLDDLRRTILDYDAEIRFADAEVGEIFERLRSADLFDDMLTIVTADHGEGLMTHSEMYHGLNLYEENVRVPLVVHWPSRLAKGRVVSEPVQLTDLMPTVLDLLELPARPTSDGQSLRQALMGVAKPDPNRAIYLQRRWYDATLVEGQPVRGERFAVIERRMKYIESREEDKFELFDLDADPRERKNLYAPDARAIRGLAPRLASWLNATADVAKAETEQSVSEDDRRRLQALGYVQ